MLFLLLLLLQFVVVSANNNNIPLYFKNQNIATLLPKADLAPTAVRLGFNNSIEEKLFSIRLIVLIVYSIYIYVYS